MMILAVCLVILDAATTIDIDPAGGFQDFRWYYFWDNFHPVIPFSLMIGVFFVVLGVLLKRYRNQAIAK